VGLLFCWGVFFISGVVICAGRGFVLYPHRSHSHKRKKLEPSGLRQCRCCGRRANPRRLRVIGSGAGAAR